MPRRLVAVAIAGAAVGVGLVAEWAAFGFGRPLRWIPDVVVGLAFVGAGLTTWPRQRGAGSLLVVTGFAWFAGSLGAAALFWHRGPLVHLLVAYPGSRPRSRVAAATVGLGYVVAATPLWRHELASAALSAVLFGVVALGYLRAAGPLRHHRRAALWATAALTAALTGGAAARSIVPAGAAVLPALLVYEVVLVVVAVGLAVAAHRVATPVITDLVVDLGAARSGVLRDELAQALGDPGLQVGYWTDQDTGYVDPEGVPLVLPDPGGSQVATSVSRDGRPYALLVHDRAVLDDPALVDAVATATRLTASHAKLRADVRAQLAELTASRRRLVVAADEQRRVLEQRLRAGPQARLEGLRDMLQALNRRDGDPHLRRAVKQVTGTLNDLAELARGLHPRELADGLAVALAGLADRSPVPVRLAVTDERFPPEVEVAAWYACVEALTNTVKHADAPSVVIDVHRDEEHLVVEVTDNGRGGADPAAGTGLRGLTDRLEALGGRLTITTAAGVGTRLRADIPLAQAR